MASSASLSPAQLVAAIERIHTQIRARVIDACQSADLEALRGTARPGAGDFIYAIDRISEQELVQLVTREVACHDPVVLIGEGIPGGQLVLPSGTREPDALWRIIVDPIDGTRGLMYQKRSGWILTGAAPNRGAATCLADLQIAVQTEIPLVKQHLCDQFSAVAGGGVVARRWNRLTSHAEPLAPQPSQATDLRHGFATICRFFPGGRDLLARLDDELALASVGPWQDGEAWVFEDQYASTAGQLYGLLMGQDRLVADLRPLIAPVLRARGEPLGLCCHPYDLCTELIAREAGVHIVAPGGTRVQVPLDTQTPVCWVGYANRALRERVEPILAELLLQHGLAG
jgi:hypothetical protein